MSQSTRYDEAKCLQVNPFEGDFGSPGDKILQDKIVTARAGGLCGICCQQIEIGSRIRTLAAIFDGEMMRYRWCAECSEAMAISSIDEGKRWEARARVGRDARQNSARFAIRGSAGF